MAELFTTTNLIALATLTLLEVVLGIDNVIFIAILAGRLPESQRARARSLGISLAVLSRLLLLLSITWIMRLQAPLFELLGHSFSGRDLILLIGGMFLIGKSTLEIHHKLEGEEHTDKGAATATMAGVLAQIIVIDVVFSLDSVITAIGVSGVLVVMIPAVLIAAVGMLVFAGAISRFIERHPTMKILALAFLIMIGALLVIEGWNPEIAHDLHLRNYIYFAMIFSVILEFINIRVRKAAQPVHLRPSNLHRSHLPEA